MSIEGLRSSIGKLFSYIFMTSIFLLAISAFFLIVVVVFLCASLFSPAEAQGRREIQYKNERIQFREPRMNSNKHEFGIHDRIRVN